MSDIPTRSASIRPSRSAWLLALSNFCLQLALQATYFVGIIGSATYGLATDASGVSLLVFLLNLSLIVGSFIGGVIVDRFGPVRVLAGAFIVLVAYGVTCALASLSYPLLAGAALIHGLAGGVGAAAVDAWPRYLFSASDAADLLVVNSYSNTAMCVAMIAGPALGASIASVRPTSQVFLIATVSALLGFPLVACLGRATEKDGRRAATMGRSVQAMPDVPETPAAKKLGDALGEALAGVRITFANHELALVFAMGFLGYFAFGAFDSLEFLFYRDVLQAGVSWMGWLTMISGIGGTIGSAAIAAMKGQRQDLRMLAVLLLVIGAGSVLYVGTSLLPVTALGQAICGFGFGASGPVRTTLVQQRCDRSHVGRVVAFMRIGLNLAGVLPLLVAPFLANLFGVQQVLVGAAAFVTLMGIVFTAYLSKKDGRRSVSL